MRVAETSVPRAIWRNVVGGGGDKSSGVEVALCGASNPTARQEVTEWSQNWVKRMAGRVWLCVRRTSTSTLACWKRWVTSSARGCCGLPRPALASTSSCQTSVPLLLILGEEMCLCVVQSVWPCLCDVQSVWPCLCEVQSV